MLCTFVGRMEEESSRREIVFCALSIFTTISTATSTRLVSDLTPAATTQPFGLSTALVASYQDLISQAGTALATTS